MENEATSFWADIKKYEETLARDPASYCFAPLAEVYRKIGLLDDAITIAKKGCEIHPEYVGGYMALGRAFLEKGLKEESRQALEKVVGITPDNLLALKLLSQLYVEEGEKPAAEKTLLLILEQAPEDSESRALLETIRKALPNTEQVEYENNESLAPCIGEIAAPVEESLLENEEDLEEAEIVEYLEASATSGKNDFEEKEVYSSPPEQDDVSGYDEAVSEGSDVYLTVTMAELYLSQGLPEKARAIYQQMLHDDPDNLNLKTRLDSLDYASAPDSFSHDDMGACVSPALIPEDVKVGVSSLTEEHDRIIGTLEKWLDNIKRRH